MNYKGILLFLIGAAAGSLATWQIMNVKHEQELDEQYDQIIADLEFEKAERGNFKQTMSEYGADDPGLEQLMERRVGKNYNEIYRTKPSIEELMEKNDRPYLIDMPSFGMGAPDYDKLTYTYYEEDGILVDEAEEIVPTPGDIIGDDSLLKFGEGGSEDPNIVYVRNDKIATDFEIIRVHQSYQETVLGIPKEEPPRKKVKREQRKDE